MGPGGDRTTGWASRDPAGERAWRRARPPGGRCAHGPSRRHLPLHGGSVPSADCARGGWGPGDHWLARVAGPVAFPSPLSKGRARAP